jgi:undecaprenyl diphosphate synthase
MDGNGRWAQKRGMPRNMGHREGSNALKRIAVFCSDIGIRYLTVYAFSTENWSRPKSEVDTLMSLLEEFLRKADAELEGKNIKIKTIGDISKLSPSIQSEIKRVENNTKNNDGMTLVIALNYGGRDDILYAIKNIAKGVRRGTIKPDEINSELCKLHKDLI